MQVSCHPALTGNSWQGPKMSGCGGDGEGLGGGPGGGGLGGSGDGGGDGSGGRGLGGSGGCGLGGGFESEPHSTVRSSTTQCALLGVNETLSTAEKELGKVTKTGACVLEVTA